MAVDDEGGRVLRPKPDVICRRLGDGAVLVDLATNQIFELNRTGHRIWELLGEGLSRQAMGNQLEQEFSVERRQLEQEVDDLLHALRLEQLITES